ncbi:MAG TPA: P-type conjugative transfer protein TrbL [Candidatus Aphodousia faecavium]|nr:P-type conjugative transfer protein TrbL [Candidatus Aphodousia faecavium]
MQSWIPYALKSLKIFLLVAVVAIGLMALDASAEEQVFDTILAKYQSAAAHWQGIMLSAAKSIFWPLALISLSWRLIQRAIDGVDIPGLFREIFWPGFFIGFYYFLLVNGSNIASAILSTFMHLADQGSAVSGMSSLAYSPSGIMSMANEIWWEVLKTSGKGIVFSFIPGTDSGFFANLLGVFVSFGIWVLLAMVAIDVLILLIASWVLLYGGLVILAFGGGFGFGFHQYAINYFRSVIALGLQLLGTGLIVTVGLSVMQTDLIAFKDGFNLQTLMSFLLCAMAMKMVVGSIPPMLAGMINGNVGALGPKGEGVIGGLVGAGVTAATTTVSLGLGAAAGAKIKAAQAGLDKVKAAVNARNAMPGAGGGASGTPNSISAAMPGGSEGASSGGSAYAKAMGLNPGGSTYGANVPPATPSSSGSSPSAGASASTSPSATAQATPTASGTTNAQSANAQATPSEGSGGSASVAPNLSMDFGIPTGSQGSTSIESSSNDALGLREDLGQNIGLNPANSINNGSIQSDDDYLQMTPSQLEAKQKEFEEQVRKYSAKRDYHYASARSALVSGSKTLFNYMAFFNNRGYF